MGGNSQSRTINPELARHSDPDHLARRLALRRGNLYVCPVGYPGDGKSTFLNLANGLIDGGQSILFGTGAKPVGETITKTKSKALRLFEGHEDKYGNGRQIIVWDHPGLVVDPVEEGALSPDDAVTLWLAMADHKLKEGDVVEVKPTSQEVREIDARAPNPQQKSSVILAFVEASKLQRLPEDHECLDAIRRLKSHRHGLRVLLVVTKVDEYTVNGSQVSRDELLYREKGGFKEIYSDAKKKLDIDASNVFPSGWLHSTDFDFTKHDDPMAMSMRHLLDQINTCV